MDLTEKFLAKIGGWEVIKQARALVAMGKVLESAWHPPRLFGVVQDGSSTYKAGLVIHDAINLDNLCTCRQSRQWGTVCAHSVAVGLQVLAPPVAPTPVKPLPDRALPDDRNVAPSASLPFWNKNTTGAELLIHVILPPSWANAAATGRWTLFFEVERGRNRCPLSAIEVGSSVSVQSEDIPLVEWLEKRSPGVVPSMVNLTSAQFGEALQTLRGHPRFHLGKQADLSVGTVPLAPHFVANLLTTGEIEVRFRSESERPQVIRLGDDLWTLRGSEWSTVGMPMSLRALLEKPSLVIPRLQVPHFLSQEVPGLLQSGQLKADFSLEQFEFSMTPPQIGLKLVGGLAMLDASITIRYGEGKELEPGLGAPTDFWLPDSTNPMRYSSRDLGLEQEAVLTLVRAGFEGPKDKVWQMRGQDSVLKFFARHYPLLRKQWNVELEERLQQSCRKNLEQVVGRVEITPSGVQWFDLSVGYQTESGQAVPMHEIQKLLRSGQSSFRLPNGKFGLIESESLAEIEEVLRDATSTQHGGAYRIPATQAGFVERSLREAGGFKMQAPAAWQAQAVDPLAGAVQPPELGKLGEMLRDYQRLGVQWFWALRGRKFGGILADEMGLGKTLQTLAYFRAVQVEAVSATPSREKPIHLVVCPSSLVWNWENEARLFTPELKVLVLTGAERSGKFNEAMHHDLLITSYGTLRRDMEKYRSIPLHTVVLDEAQHIKNRQTQNASAVKGLRAGHRFVLTGTPLENSVLDLWSIFDFLMPGYLGTSQEFKERYEVPIVREKNGAAQKRLARRIQPFLLRRLKRQVAPQLPEKIDQILYCDLQPKQRVIYQQILQSTRQELSEAVGSQGLAKSRMLVFTALLRLRQVCCDLRLLQLKESPLPGESGGKWDLFDELLDEVIDGGHRTLVFSQFTSMLALLRQKFDESGVPYCYLDGSTVDRGAVVQQFQRRSDIPVFLISLKAGGVGLNLTAADTVIHYDPWWNPAVEEQATARAHRIGQDRVVTSYKLITRGTVEDKIVTLQNRKRALLQGMFGNEEAFSESLGWDEIQDLLSS